MFTRRVFEALVNAEGYNFSFHDITGSCYNELNARCEKFLDYTFSNGVKVRDVIEGKEDDAAIEFVRSRHTTGFKDWHFGIVTYNGDILNYGEALNLIAHAYAPKQMDIFIDAPVVRY